MSQEPPKLAVDSIRQHPRISIPGQVFWSSERTEGWCNLLTLSSAGVGISPQRSVLRPRKGSQFSLTFIINDLCFEGINSETVEVAADRLCLRFVNLGKSLQTRITNLIDSIGSGSP